MDLGRQFEFDYEASKALSSNVIKGIKYRITILTERLVRLEYNENGIFEDRPTELVWFRNTPKVNFKVREDSRYLEVSTNYFRLTYLKEKPFYGG